MKFFIPHLRDDPDAAEAEWQRYLAETPAPINSRRVYSMEYEHGDSRFAVTVGAPRKEWKRRRGPRGGHIKNAGYLPYPTDTGSVVSGIIHAGGLIYVWSYGPPFGGWGNPSLVGPDSVTDVELFEEPS